MGNPAAVATQTFPVCRSCDTAHPTVGPDGLCFDCWRGGRARLGAACDAYDADSAEERQADRDAADALADCCEVAKLLSRCHVGGGS